MHPPLTLCRWRNVQQQFPDVSNYAPPQRPDEWPLWWVQCVALTARGTDSFALSVWKNKTVYTTQAVSRHFTFWIGLDDAFLLLCIHKEPVFFSQVSTQQLNGALRKQGSSSRSWLEVGSPLLSQAGVNSITFDCYYTLSHCANVKLP